MNEIEISDRKQIKVNLNSKTNRQKKFRNKTEDLDYLRIRYKLADTTTLS